MKHLGVTTAVVSSPTPEPRSRFDERRWQWGLFVGGWLLISLIVVGSLYLSIAAEDRPLPVAQIAAELIGLLLWALLFPLIWGVTRRFPFRRSRWPSWLMVNLVLGLAISSFYGLLALINKQIIQNIVTGKLAAFTLRQLPQYLLTSIEFFFAIYFAIVAGMHAVQYYQKYRARAFKASRLETQLAVAQLNVLKMQLHPHFLFNTLNAISALMHHDVEAADRMITKLSDLLRLSLDKDERHQVSLGEELKFLDHYVAIEMIRFRDRLNVTMDIEPDCLEAMVPKLVLQPLVENAIRHGIAMRSAAGRVQLRGRRRADKLRIEVADDGPGMPPGAVGVREGVGLANTRARLEQLYGHDQRFLVRNARIGGFEVVFEIPFEVKERVPLQGVA